MKTYYALFIVALSFCLSSCASNIKYSGNTLDKDALSKIIIFSTSKNQIKELIGPPSLESRYGEEVWYYVSEKIKSYGFTTPKVIEREIVSFLFNKEGKVTDIQRSTLKDGNNIQINNEKTISKGISGSPVKHFLDNLGRFNTMNKKTMPGRPKGLS